MTRNFLLPLLASAVFLSACAAEQKPQAVQLQPTVPAVAPEPVTSQPLPDLAARVTNLETNVAGLQSDMSAAKPKLEKVDVIDRKFRELSLELNNIDQRAAAAPTAQPAQPTAAPVAKTDVKKDAPKKETPKPAAKKTTEGLQVQQLRIGAQADKTRLVLDTTAPARISYDVDNAEKILVITIPKAQWAGAVKGVAANNPLISAWQANKAADGVQLVLQLKQPVKVLGSNQLAATATASDRVYVDLAAAK
jgi:hypothetical protein